MNVVGYIRVSSQEQADSGLGLAAQEARIQKYCDLYEHTLIRLWTDEGVSAKNRKRKGLQSALADLRAQKAEALVVMKLDRLTRSVGDLTYFMEKVFKPGGPALCVVDEFIQTRTAAGRLVAVVLTGFSQYEREVGGERTKAALDVKKQRGERTGECPYGYEANEDGKLVKKQSEQEVLRYIYNSRHQKGLPALPFDKIADMLYSLGYRTRAYGTIKNGHMQEGRFTKGTVQRLYKLAADEFSNRESEDVAA